MIIYSWFVVVVVVVDVLYIRVYNNVFFDLVLVFSLKNIYELIEGIVRKFVILEM